MKKSLVIGGVVLLLAGLYFYPINAENSEEPSKPDFKTSKVLKGDFAVKISATGIVEPNFKVEVKSKASGEVLSFFYTIPFFERKGQYFATGFGFNFYLALGFNATRG